MKRQLSAIMAGVFGIMTIGFSTAVFSQALEEIIVTAQKREQSLQDVPISVNVYSGDYITSTGFQNLQTFADLIPAVSIVEGATSDLITVRGINTPGVAPNFEQSVGSFIDGVYYGQGAQSRQRFLDIERIEILRGPQSTYFGNNTIAGALSITTRKPGDELEGFIRGTYGPDDEDYGIQAAYGGPVTDTLGVRAAINWTGYDGFLENTFQGGRTEPNEDSISGRITAVWTPTDDFDATFKMEYGKFEQEGREIEIEQCPPPASIFPGGRIPGPGFANGLGVACAFLLGQSFIPPLNALAEPTFDNSVNGQSQRGENGNGNIGGLSARGDDLIIHNSTYSLTMNYQVGDHTLTSISAYNGYRLDRTVDIDNNPVAVVYVSDPIDYDLFSQELRIASPTGGQFEYLAGVYWQQEKLFVEQTIGAPLPLASPPIAAAGLSGRVQQYIPFKQDTESFAIFGALTWNVTDALRATFGLRFTDVEKEATRRVTLSDPALFPVPRLGPPTPGLDGNPQTGSFNVPLTAYSRSDDDLTPSFTIQYDVSEDDMVYFKYAEGFKAGGFDLQALTGDDDTVLFDPEGVDAYEIGAKTTWLDGTLRANVALFLSEFSDQQVSILAPNGTSFFVDNAAASTIQGVELDARWALTDNLTVGTAIAYLDAKYDEFNNGPCNFVKIVLGTCANQAAQADDLTGQTLTYSAEWTGNVTVDYVYPLANGMEIASNLAVKFTTDYSTRTDNDPRLFQQDKYAKVDLRVALSRDTWEVAVSGINIFDAEVYPLSNRLVAAAGSVYHQIDRGAHVLLSAQYGW